MVLLTVNGLKPERRLLPAKMQRFIEFFRERLAAKDWRSEHNDPTTAIGTLRQFAALQRRVRS